MITSLGFVEGLGEVKQSDGDFFTNLRELEGKIISPRDEAYARLRTKDTTQIGRHMGRVYGTWTTAGFEYAKSQPPILRLSSKLLNEELAKQAVQANRAGKYFSTETTKEYYESAQIAEKEAKTGIEPEKRSVILLPSRRQFTLSDTQNWEILQAILKDQAKPYFELNGPIIVYPVSPENIYLQDGTLLTQLCFFWLRYKSSFSGGRGLDNDSRAHRVFDKTSEGNLQKTIKLEVQNYTLKTTKPRVSKYTSEELSNYIKIAKEAIAVNLPNSKLEEIVEFLESLRQ